MAVHPGGTMEVRVLVHLQNRVAVKDMEKHIKCCTVVIEIEVTLVFSYICNYL